MHKGFLKGGLANKTRMRILLINKLLFFYFFLLITQDKKIFLWEIQNIKPLKIKVTGTTQENIQELLDYCSSVSILDLSDNHIGTEGVKDIANSQTLQNLTSLNLSRNNIGENGASYI